MNIKIPYQWLIQHLDTPATPEELAKYLSLSGPSVERVESIHNDQVLDIEVTSNRVDAMSVRGIAREAAAILPEFHIPATLKPLDLSSITQILKHPKLPVLDLKIKNNPILCHRILALKINSVTIKDSPTWLQARLIQVGQRPLNNIIDLTNYIMWDIGHPIHAFDYDRLTQKTILVREAKPGEFFTTLDHKQFTCLGGEVIFDDGTGTIIDLPGIMGTSNTTITSNTKNVLLWIESVDAVKIRTTSMNHAIRTQAAILNEKQVDPHLGETAILSASQLALKLAGGKVDSQLFDLFPPTSVPAHLTLKDADITRYLGIEIKPKIVTRIFTHLEFQINYDSKNSVYHLTPPTFRQNDVTIYQDLIEEIARIYGYHNLPSTLMPTTTPNHPDTTQYQLEDSLRHWLIGMGAQELYTYSMVSSQLASASGYPLADHLTIKNPLTDDYVYMRRSLIPSLIEVIHTNPFTQTTLFELQHTYHPSPQQDQLPTQVLELAILTNQSYAHLKGILDQLMNKLFLASYVIHPQALDHHSFDPANCGNITYKKTVVGAIGQLIIKDLFACVLKIDQLSHIAHTFPPSLTTYPFAPIIEDLTFTLPANTYLGPIIESIKNSSDLITSVTLTNQYHHNYTFTIHYRDPQTTLKDTDITPLRKRLVHQLHQKFQAKLVGTLD